MIDPHETPGGPTPSPTIADVYSEVRRCNRQVAELTTTLMGTPASRESGMVVQVDRLKQSQERQSKLLWIIGGGLVAALIEAARDMLTRSS